MANYEYSTIIYVNDQNTKLYDNDIFELFDYRN